ncbi:hypothetical protein [Variovorax soli]|uniref:Uncharacterized protein n=1 Tax=Variovorax soli TaxID=376815 RepID=A0ABU1NMU6_9BURK|nr:hypothetical protein [Variovorax soli]MDR6539721.1 hypothetical protein [Variovorax soli]
MKTLYVGTRLVSPCLKDGTVVVGATKQKDAGHFEPVPASKVRLSDKVSDAELGAAVMAALLASE